MTQPDSKLARRARLVGTAALLLWPFSYTWMAVGDPTPGWAFAATALSELGAIVLGVTAIVAGMRARRLWRDSADASWAIRLGAVALALVLVGNVLGVAVFS